MAVGSIVVNGGTSVIFGGTLPKKGDGGTLVINSGTGSKERWYFDSENSTSVKSGGTLELLGDTLVTKAGTLI